jgi:large subunit ribosomal protein L22
MKGYSCSFEKESCASARLEGVDASYKDLSEVCGRIRRKDASWARAFLESAAEAEIPVLYKHHNKRLGHRRELGGRKGRYPWKAAGIVLKVLNSAIANGMTKGLGEGYTVLVATANKKASYPRMAPKGRTARSYYELARIEIVLKSKGEAPKGVEVKTPAKEKKAEAQKSEEVKAGEPKKDEVAPKHEEHPHVHKHEMEKEQNEAHAHHERYAYEHAKGKKPVAGR